MRSLIVAALLATLAFSAKVPTPAGSRPSECVHQIPSGTHVHRNPDGSDRLVFPDGTEHHKEPCFQYGSIKRHYQMTAEEKKNLKDNGNGVVGYSGWTTYTSWQFDEGVSKFIGYWNVPDKPMNGSYPNPLYTFTALQNIDWVPQGSDNSTTDPHTLPARPFDIIQPVMEFYSQGNWSISSWIVSLNGGHTYYTPQVHTDVGTEVFGNMTKIGDRSWFINTVRMADAANTTLVLHYNADPDDRLNEQNWAYTAIECYFCTGCSTYPDNELKYYNMQLWDMKGREIYPQWADMVEKRIHWCNEGVKTQNSGELTYHFQHKKN